QGSPLVAMLVELTKELLGRAEVAPADDFFALGGTSMTAARLAALCSARLGVRAGLAAVFQHPRLADLAQHLERLSLPDAKPSGPHPPKQLPRAVCTGARLPLSAMQRRFVFLSAGADAPDLNVPLVLELRGSLDVDALAAALTDVLSSHEQLRVRLLDGPEGGQDQVAEVLPVDGSEVRDAMVPTVLADFQACRAAAQALANEPVDLSVGTVRLALFTDGDMHLLLLCLHHIACDGESLEVLVGQLGERYTAHLAGAQTPPAHQLQYSDVAVQNDALEPGLAEGMLRRRVEALAGSSDLRCLQPGDGRPDHSGAEVSVGVDLRALQQLASNAATTPYAVLVALWQLVLYRWSGQDDFAVGVPTSLRRQGEHDDVVGPLINTLAIPTRFRSSGTVRQHLKDVTLALAEAHADQLLPFEQLVQALAPKREAGAFPIVQNVVAWEGRRDTFEMGPVSLTPVALASTSTQFPLALEVFEDGDTMRAVLRYSTTLVGGADASDLASLLTHVLDAAPACLDGPLFALAEARIPSSEGTVSHAGGGDATAFCSVLDRVMQLPADRPAVEDSRGALSHGDLRARVEELAERLAARSVRRGDRVCVLLPRSMDSVVALLAVLRCGAVYVPVESSAPPERILRLVELSGAHVMVLSRHDQRAGQFLPSHVEAVTLPVGPTGVKAAVPVPAPVLLPSSPAYLIFTSGSTGTPNGVLVGHGELAAFRDAIAPSWEEDEALVAVTSVGFDVSVLELLVALSLGARVVLYDATGPFDPQSLAELVERSQATRLYSVPTLWQELLEADADLSGLTGGCGGEPMPTALTRRAAARGVRLLNLYGPTETVIWVTEHVAEASGEASDIAEPQMRVPIGTPLAGVAVHVLDRWARPVLAGVPGEMYVGGATVAQGYAEAPRLTALRFVPDPAGDGSRLYRTGDWARTNRLGSLEFVGRTDDQVKLRGHRLELGEVEAALLTHPGVAAVAVTMHGERLVAHVVRGGVSLDAQALRDHVKLVLSSYMRPSLHFIDRLPTTVNGKVDRTALEAPDVRAVDGVEAAEPLRDALERIVGEVWRTVLGQGVVDRDANFFDLGGDSIGALRLAEILSRVLRVDVPVIAVFQAQSVAEQAAFLRVSSATVDAVAAVAEQLFNSEGAL
ncbi:MAG: hypothetical protein QOE58_2675, partial [Actinomycetota bacterium]|nr:hypothetical protein [Actinomycetota bacterium]